MLFGEIITVALGALRANKLRSILTMLGIVIGVGAVIAMVAIGGGAQSAVKDRITSLGTTLLTVSPGAARTGGVQAAQDPTGAGNAPLTLDDAQALIDSSKGLIAAVQPEMAGNQQVTYLNKNINTNILGTTSNYLEVRKYSLLAGRMFDPTEDEELRRVAVVGAAVPTNLGLASPEGLLGEQIRINGIRHEVIGVLASKGQTSAMGGNPDDQILIPIRTAKYRVIGGDRLRGIGVLSPSEDKVMDTMGEIERILRRSHKLRVGQASNFQIRNASDFLATLGETTAIFTWLLSGIAAVSLIVGGIGIMNIMLVSVTERTREIGIRKALGATRANILLQFLIEAIVLCCLGGIIGIAVGGGGAILIGQTSGFKVEISESAVILAFAFSAAVGLIFGVWPARRAAVLDPIVALRYE
jgi:putative ABC transport system permease protein